MKQQDIVARLKSAFGADAIVAAGEFREQMSVMVPAGRILDVCRYLQQEPDLLFNFCSFVAGVDRYPATPRFEIVYQLHSLKHNHRFRVKTMALESDKGLPTVESVTSLWPTADWHERETGEMFGVKFLNHPDFRKLMLPEHWKVHPLRKEFPLEGTEEDTPDLSPSN